MASKEMALFLAHSVELESEAKERYEELADVMAQHHNDEVAAFFLRMAKEAEHHLAEVAELAGKVELPQLKPWEFLWPGAEPPETSSYEAVHYRMTLREAMTLALGNENQARSFYQQSADNAQEEETVTLAHRFAEEEASHAHELECMLKELPEAGAMSREEDDDPHMPE